MSTNIPESHDKEIKEDSINYFTHKLQQRFRLLKQLIYLSLAIIIFDIILLILIPTVLRNAINISSLIIMTIDFLYCLHVFRHNFKIVSYYIYKSTNIVIYSLTTCLVLYYFNMFYLLLCRILLNATDISELYGDSFFAVFFGIILFFFYFLINMSLPVIVLFKLFQVRNVVKKLGQAQGQSYDFIPNIEIPSITVTGDIPVEIE